MGYAQTRPLPPGGAQPGPAVPADAATSAKPVVPTARVSGRVTAADTGKPVRRATVSLMAQPTKVMRYALTDADGRYQFTGVPAGRYGLTPSRQGFVFVAENPFAGGRGLDLVDGDIADDTDFVLSRGSVIKGRITDEFGEPVAGVLVQAARYQFRPSGQRQLIMGSSGNYFMPASSNDLGEFRIFGLRPGSYYVSARPDTSGAIAISQSGGGISGVDSGDGLTTTYYPGTANPGDAQSVRVELMQEGNATFSLVPSRMARITGTVRDSQGRPISSGTRITLRPNAGMGIVGWFGNPNSALGPNGSFAIANVSPGEYILDVRPAGGPGGGLPSITEYASVPLAVTGEDIGDLEVVTRSGVSVSGRVIFEGTSNVAQPNLRISAGSEEQARNAVGFVGADSGQVAPDGQFHIPSVFGTVVFRPGFLPLTAILKSVRLNGVDITNTPYDTTGMDDIVGLEVVISDKPGRIFGFARNERGEVQYNYRLVTYPAHLKPGDVTIRYQHNTSPNVKGQFNAGRMPAGEYIGLAVKGVHPGEEWDPELRKRIEQYGKRFTLNEGEALELEMPYVE